MSPLSCGMSACMLVTLSEPSLPSVHPLRQRKKEIDRKLKGENSEFRPKRDPRQAPTGVAFQDHKHAMAV